MSVYQYIDPTADEAEGLFWSLVPVVAEQAGITHADAFYHIQRTWVDRLKGMKPHHAIDHAPDGRSAIWRVRLMIWRTGPEGQEELHADSDPELAFSPDNVAAGSTLINGLPTVATWVRELAIQAHPHGILEGLEAQVLAHKIKSLRVALSNQGGDCVWRLRYTVTPEAAPEAPRPAGAGLVRREPGVSLLKTTAQASRPQHFRANVYVQREESPRGK